MGTNGDLPLNVEVVKEKFSQLAREIGDHRSPEAVAAGFLAIAVDKMANAIKKISLQRGYDVSEYTLCCFGGAGGQHACLIADVLGIKQVFIHPYAGVLSAYGMGLADVRVIREKAIESILSESLRLDLESGFGILIAAGKTELNRQNDKIEIYQKVHLKYAGTDAALTVDFAPVVEMQSQFESLHRQRYGFIAPEKQLVVEAIAVEVVAKQNPPLQTEFSRQHDEKPVAIANVQMYTDGNWQTTPVYQRADLQVGDRITGLLLSSNPQVQILLNPIGKEKSHYIKT